MAAASAMHTPLHDRLPAATLAGLVARHATAAGCALPILPPVGRGPAVSDDGEVVARVGGPPPFAGLLADALNDVLAAQRQLEERATELATLHDISRLTAGSRDVGRALQEIVRLVADVTDARSASIRLLDEAGGDELKIAAVHNLSDAYLAKGRIRLADAKIDQEALSPRGFAVVEDMGRDPRVLFPDQARHEGIVSVLVAGMTSQDKPIGVLRIYTDRPHAFRRREVDLLQSVAAMAAAAIVNVRLREEVAEAERVERQLEIAAEVQQRMLPQQSPDLPGMDLAGLYVPAQELAGDIYDYIPLPGDNLGVLVADVSGKGVPASLVGMAVRASLRAQVDHVYNLAEAVGGLNYMLVRDTRPGEFVTLFYGVIDVRRRRLTYCCAGHPPALLWRDGAIHQLTTEDMLLGIVPEATFEQKVIDLKAGDRVMIYTDGLQDAVNPAGERFGDDRILAAFAQSAGRPRAEDAARHVAVTLRQFVGGATRSDDVTAAFIHVGKPPAA